MELTGILLLSVFASVAFGASTCGKLHQVHRRDTCLSISKASKLTLQEFLSLNPAINCTQLAVGEQVCTSSCLRAAGLESPGPRPVLIDYVGAMGTDITFADVPIAKNLDHYFILSFAIDANRSGIVQNGSFIKYWSDNFTPESVAEIKAKYPNVKVLMSLAGYSIHVNGEDQIVKWYDPADVDLWIDNAVKSISSLVEEFHLDGVDIDYESMDSAEGLRLFPFCIGEVIKSLKESKVISVATIAPYGNSASTYQRLLRYYGDQFDYVNFQFYSYSDVTNASAFVDLYHKVARGFDTEKLLVSAEVDGKAAGRGIGSAEFFKAVTTLRAVHNVPGVFLWSAEGSMENGFLFEKVADCNLG